MNVLNQGIIKHKMGLLNLADELRNVSQACRVMGVSRDTFYRVKEAKESGCRRYCTKISAGRISRTAWTRPLSRPSSPSPPDNPAAGQVRGSNELRK